MNNHSDNHAVTEKSDFVFINPIFLNLKNHQQGWKQQRWFQYRKLYYVPNDLHLINWNEDLLCLWKFKLLNLYSI